MKDKKFIMTSLNDENSKAISEVLGNKTCKKIIDYLGDVRQASEKDISSELKIPINTVEYNLKKLIKAGLVEKTSNFFWSVKGKKIPMYKLANKHIIISPKKISLSQIKSIIPVVLAMALILVLAGFYLIPDSPDNKIGLNDDKIKQFSSQAELNNFLEENSNIRESGFFESLFRNFGATEAIAGITQDADVSAGSKSAGADDYSTTNIQVEGVDEADFVKNDGKYIYVVSGNKLIIVNAYPAENMEILSEIKFDSKVVVGDIYINDDKLIVFANKYGGYYEEAVSKKSVSGEAICLNCGSSIQKTMVYIYNISNKKNPELEHEIENDGNYVNSRMIGDYVYLITNNYINGLNPTPPVYEANGVTVRASADEIYYFDYEDSNYVFTNIMAININGDINSKVFLTGGASTIYVSEDNIYLTYTKWIDSDDYSNRKIEEVYLPLLPSHEDEIKEILDSDERGYKKLREVENIFNDYIKDLDPKDLGEFSEALKDNLEEFEKQISKELEKTVVHKISVNEEKIEYENVGDVPGRVLNQFSMDEYNGDFRIATTNGQSWNGESVNNLYILDEDLKIIGKVEDLAKGERIYSVRFMGKRAYMVTFRQVDPLFVIDVENPKNPKVLGYLKITGYSDYLHPYDENHIIGIGKEATEEGRFKGMKISLFDVSNVENPIEISKYEIGDRGTNSDALYDHRAFLFDKEKGILVIPVSLSEINLANYGNDDELLEWAYGERVWEGAYVFNINLKEIKLKGKITHNDEVLADEYGYKIFPYENQIKRSLYLDDVLYTISLNKIKANDLSDLNGINSVGLGYEGPIYRYGISG